MQILPFVPNGRPNMIGWLAAQSDAPNYGRAVSFAFPSSATVYGPTQVEAAVNQDPTVSQQLTLWGQEGSRVIIGNLLVMPIEDSLLYVEPLYLQSSTTALPQLKRVIVFYRASTSAGVTLIGGQQKVAMQPTLAGALTEIFGAAPPAAGSGTRRDHAHDDAHRPRLGSREEPDRQGQRASSRPPRRRSRPATSRATARRSRRCSPRSRRCRPPSSHAGRPPPRERHPERRRRDPNRHPRRRARRPRRFANLPDPLCSPGSRAAAWPATATVRGAARRCLSDQDLIRDCHSR